MSDESEPDSLLSIIEAALNPDVGRWDATASPYWQSLDAAPAPLTIEMLDEQTRRCYEYASQPQVMVVSPAMKLQIEVAERRYRRWDQRAKRAILRAWWRFKWAGPWGALRRRRRDARYEEEAT